MRIRVIPESKKELKGVLIRWAAIAALFCILIVISISMPGKSYTGPFLPLSEEEQVLKKRLEKNVVYLSDSVGRRNVWRYHNLASAEKHIRNELTNAGYQVNAQQFESRGKTVCNLEAVLPGRSGQTLVIGAHYDSYGQTFAANDNASGVAAALEMARALANKKLNRTLRFVFFVNEEPPFFGTAEMGSLVYARSLKQAKVDVYGMFSLETIGCYFEETGSQKYPFIFGWFYPNKGNFISFVGNLSSRGLVRKTIRLFRENVKFPSEAIAAPGWIKGLGWSDHWSFWKTGFKALMITDTAPYRYKHYHTEQDTWDKLDYEKMARVVGGLLTITEKIADE